jgi:hypothetical protein
MSVMTPQFTDSFPILRRDALLFSDSGAATEYATNSGLLAPKGRPVDLPDGDAKKTASEHAASADSKFV